MNPLNPFEISFLGTHLIEASAGTGKTYNIESLYVRAIVEANQSVDEILVVTYTEAATKELRDRLMRRLTESIEALKGKEFENDDFLSKLPKHIDDQPAAISRLEKAIRSFDEASVYTIHGFCGQALRDHAFESGAAFDAELIGDDREIVGELVDDYWRKWVRQASKNAIKRPLLQFLLEEGYTPEKLTSELAPYWGRPYLVIKPDEVPPETYDKVIYELRDLYEQMQHLWPRENQNIRSLLLSEPISGQRYREGYLQNWMPAMDEWLDQDVLPIHQFDKFSRFSQSYVDESLKKSSEKKGIKPPRHPFFGYVDSYIEKADSLDDFVTQFKRWLFSDLSTQIDDQKEELQVYSYDDLLVQLKNALYDEERGRVLSTKLRQTYPIALVDEFQDTDPVQYQIFSRIYSGAEDAALFMIGDPKQSIYSFRGADIFSYLQARHQVPAGNIFSLNHNYRSVPSLISGINALFSYQENPFILKDISFQPVQPGRKKYVDFTLNDSTLAPIQVRYLPFDTKEGPLSKKSANRITSMDTAAQIQQLLINARNGEAMIGGQQLKSGDIAVLVGTHRQAKRIRDTLQQYGIKSVTHSKASVFDTDEASELCTLLKAVIEPGDESLVTAALSTSMFDYLALDLLALKENERAWAAKVNQFSGWHEQWQNYGFARMFRTLWQDETVAETLMLHNNGERKCTNLLHLSELIQSEQENGKQGMHALLKWLQKKRQETNKEIEEEQLRLESDENLVKVITRHHSKGLEYPVVFCPFMWNSIKKRDKGAPIVYHSPEGKTIKYLDMGGKDDPDRVQKRYLKDKEALAEGVRLAYVAVTRAEYRCVINGMPAKESAYSPLGLLLLGSEKSLECLGASIFPDRERNDGVVARFSEAIEDLANHPSIESSIITPVFEPEPQTLQNQEPDQLQARSFNRALPLPGESGMSSFSSITHSESDDFEPDFRVYYDESVNRMEEQGRPGNDTIFDFPKGPDPGTAIHHIFENIEFSDSEHWHTVITEQLQNQKIDPKWENIVHQMLAVSVNKALLSNQPSFSLAAIDPARMIAEMEFYVTNSQISLTHLLSIIRKDEPQPAVIDGFAPEGFLKGFIDLTFKYNDKYYILDYKTNHLGSAIEDYSQNQLGKEMQEALYDVQYHLYLVALHRFLKQHVPQYHYETHAGGAFYLFLRGINPEGREGLFFDQPDANLINELDEYLKREGV